MIVMVMYNKLVDEVIVGSWILFDDGCVEMKVDIVDKVQQILYCIVIVGGVFFNNKGVNFLDVQLFVCVFMDKDKIDLVFGFSQGVDWVVFSFVCNFFDMEEICGLICEYGYEIFVVVKIEKFEVIDQIDLILLFCDGVMVVCGDLGVEMLVEEVLLLQKELICKVNSLGILIIMVIQMLDFMVFSFWLI